MTTPSNAARKGAKIQGGYIRWAGYAYVAATVAVVLYELTRGKA